MNISITLGVILYLVTFAMGLMGIEILLLTRRKSFTLVWSYENLKNDLEFGIPLPNTVIRKIFSISGLKIISVIQILSCIACMITFHPVFVLILFFTHLSICIRFRGTFNGGSDMMIFVILSGILIYSFGAQKLGLIYITIHTLYSYFKAGLVKLVRGDWLKGLALPAFFSRSLFSDINILADWLKQNIAIALVIGWMTVIFEMSTMAWPFFAEHVFTYFAAALVFHFLIYLCFGLNRFFWAWMTAWPAVIYTLTTLHLN